MSTQSWGKLGGGRGAVLVYDMVEKLVNMRVLIIYGVCAGQNIFTSTFTWLFGK